MEPTQQKSQFEQRIIESAMKDDSFRRELLANPRTTIEHMLGSPIPPSIKIHVLEETPSSVYLVLPPTPNTTASEELTEAELATVSGGGDAWSNGDNCWMDYIIPFD